MAQTDQTTAKSAASQTTYTDPEGYQKTGYIIEGKTYTDEAGTSRVPIGSVVTTGDGAYILTDEGGMKYSDYLAQQAESSSDIPSQEYGTPFVDDITAAQQEAAIQALKTAYDYNMNVLNATKDQIPAEYQLARNQTASQAEIGKSNWNEYAAASGLSSGTGGQAALSLNNVLQSNLSSISESESNALAQLDLQMTQVETQYQNDIAQAIANGNLQKAEMLYDDYVRVQESIYNAAVAQANIDFNRDSLDASIASSDQSNVYALYQMMAQLGDFSWLENLGYTTEQIAALEEKYKALYGVS